MLQQSSCPSISLVKKLSLNQIMECPPLAMDHPPTIPLQSSPMIPPHMKLHQLLMELPQTHMELPQAHMELPLMSLCHHTNQLQVKDRQT